MPSLEQLSAQLDRLAAFEPGPYPVISLYLNLQTNERGRDTVEPFLRKELAERVRTYTADAPDRKSLDQDVRKLEGAFAQRSRSANGLALFTSSGAQLFEAIELSAPIDAHVLSVADRPHLYPLAKLLDQYPRYLVLLADTHTARIFVFAANAIETTQRIEGTKTKHHSMGGWSQARYQRHTENYHLHHAKEVAYAVARIVRDEGIDRIIVRGDETILPLLKDQFPKYVAERIVDSIRLDPHASERAVLEAAMARRR